MATAQAAPENPAYVRVNSFGIFTAYSNDSSHILFGVAERRKLLNIGGSYNRRILLSGTVSWQYSAELLPVALESDPLSKSVVKQVSPTVETFVMKSGPLVTCSPQTSRYDVTLPNGVNYSGTQTIFCSGRQRTIGEAFSPVGMQWNFRPRHSLQPILDWHAGTMYSTQPIPISFAGSFNFTVDAGVGVELYRTRNQSIRAEYRYHHISNADSASQNPGIDSGIFQLTFAFGR
jgi:Lipid A 3-O-deacylase (PagL)